MTISIYDFRSELKETLYDEKFLHMYSVDTQVIDSFLDDDNTIRALFELILECSFHSRTIFEAMAGSISRFFTPVDADSFMMTAYKHSINLNFPGNEEIPGFSPALGGAVMVYLKILGVFCNHEKLMCRDRWLGKYPVEYISDGEIDMLEPASRGEYERFMDFFFHDFVYEMMKLSQDVMGFSTLEHVSGVHYLSVKIARQLKFLGFELDLAKVSGAAMGHDVGKFGCRKNEQNRVAYFHYYYTGQWFKSRDIIYIRNVAINHSTWDLELDNLPIEALILIYADFRVKDDENRRMRFYTLSDSFDVILSKLDNLDEAKTRRYRMVYSFLKDFEDYMHFLGVETDPDSPSLISAPQKRRESNFSLLRDDDIVAQTKYLSIDHSVKLMHLLRNEASLGKMLESARDLSNLSGLRAYLNILEDYTIYLAPKQKQLTLNFLYDRLALPEEDIRNKCAQLMGHIIAKYDEELRKEMPEDAESESHEFTSHSLFISFTGRLLYPDSKIIEKHQDWIRKCFSPFLRGYFESQPTSSKSAAALDHLSSLYSEEAGGQVAERHMCEALPALPFHLFDDAHHESFKSYVDSKLHSESYIRRLQMLDVLHRMAVSSGRSFVEKGRFVDGLMKNMGHEGIEESLYEKYGTIKLLEAMDYPDTYKAQLFRIINFVGTSSGIYLSNLKAATHVIVKKFQIDLLKRSCFDIESSDHFYTAMHFCNILKVSTTESVRRLAGDGLIDLIPFLLSEQKNDIVFELLRALEMESFSVTKYIPSYLGKIILFLEPNELDEIVRDFSTMIKKSNSQTSMLLLMTAGIMIQNYFVYSAMTDESDEDREARLKSLIGIIMNGFVSHMPSVNQTAFNVVGMDIFKNRTLSTEEKYFVYRLMAKKLLNLSSFSGNDDELTFLHNAVGFKSVYKFITTRSVDHGPLEIPVPGRVAFFPGSFDPFSLGHKQIAREIRDLGFEVYLAVDEFSWSKRMQPNLIRRNIIKISVADELDIYTFPRDYMVNLSNEKDLESLESLFPDTEVDIVVGADVVINASAYKNIKESSVIRRFPHIIFERKSDTWNSGFSKKLEKKMTLLHEKTVQFFLEPQFESISSTQIRDYIDENRDISELVDPLAQTYIFKNGLYQREPQFKDKISIKSVDTEIVGSLTESLVSELVALETIEDPVHTYKKLFEISKKQNFKLMILRSINDNSRVIGFSAFHWLRSDKLTSEFSDDSIQNYFIENSIGRMLVIDGIFANRDTGFYNVEQIMLTETLAFAISKDYSYAIYKDAFKSSATPKLLKELDISGFSRIDGASSDESVYVVDMSSPCTLNLDIKSAIKEPFRSLTTVSDVIYTTRNRLQKSLNNLYPGSLLLNFDRSMMYEHLIKMICDENDVPTVTVEPRSLGESMCVPYGEIMKRWILPNTITKSLHVEKYFTPDLKDFTIEEFPNYLDMNLQIRMLNSFKKPVILVDDVLDRGFRLREIEPLLREHEVTVKKMFVGILSGAGKAIVDRTKIGARAAYFIPSLRVWMNETKLYPFIGGDGVSFKGGVERNIQPSVNLILPYTWPSQLKGASPRSRYELSAVCLQNAIEILQILEEEYQRINDRVLTLANLSEVIVFPRYPHKGDSLRYDFTKKPSECLLADLDALKRLDSMF